MTTPRGAPELAAAQDIPETTVNAQIRHTEQGAGFFIVADKDLATPPGSPPDGAAYIVAASPTGAWSTWTKRIAYYSGGWKSHIALEGYRAHVLDEGVVYLFDGSDWIADTGAGIPALDGLSDVNAPTPSDGDVLAWDATPGEWVAVAPSASDLDDLADVDTSGVSDGDVLTFDSGSGDWVAAAPTGGGGGASTTQDDEMIAGFIGTPANKSYTIALKMAHGGTITETVTKSASGTCTATFKVNSTGLGGTANSVSSSEQSQAHASSNTFAAGDDIVLTVSSNSSCADMSFSIKYTRTLD